MFLRLVGTRIGCRTSGRVGRTADLVPKGRFGLDVPGTTSIERLFTRTLISEQRSLTEDPIKQCVVIIILSTDYVVGSGPSVEEKGFW